MRTSERKPVSRRMMLLALVAAGTAAGSAAAGWGFISRDRRVSLLIAGSSSMLALNNALAKEFSRLNPAVDLVVEKGGSLPGLLALKRGAIDIAAMSRDLTAAEDDLRTRNFMIARNEISILLNQALPIKSLSVAQIRGLFAGDIANWKQVGGPDAQVNVISRTRGSTSRQFIEDIVLEGRDITATAKEMETHQQVAEQVAADPHAIGFIALNYNHGISGALRFAEVDGVIASRATILSGRYPFTQSFYLVLFNDKEGPARDFIAFARSPAGQKIVAQQYFVPVV